MIVIENYSQVAAQIEAERGISKAELADAIEQALISACRRKFSESAILEAKINPISGEAKIFHVLNVVKTVENPEIEIALKDAKKLSPGVSEGETLRSEVETGDFGRIAAQTAKQVIIQRIREAEKNAISSEFQQKIGQLVVGTVQRVEGRNYLVNLGRAEALLVPAEQIPNESFQQKDKIRVYIVDLLKSPKGPSILISRSHPGLLRCLFELEIPEIQDGIIEIVSISREPGKRAKVAVKSNNPAIGAVGTCVGHMGGRIQTIIREIGAEKIDVLEWNEDPKQFIANSLKPAKISSVTILNEKEKNALVVVPNDQLSLAIGKAGVNVRLAVKLTGWKLDILNEDEYAKKAPEIREKSHLSIVDRIQQDAQRMKEDASAATKASAGETAAIAPEETATAEADN